MAGYHTHDSRHSTAAGYPDLCLVRGEALIFAELKSQHGTVTPAQAAWLAALCEVTHGEAAVWRPLPGQRSSGNYSVGEKE